ncbi:GumC family protein [Pleurocapsa sp. FMAR1]|uniref:GumC family protein n=1 Tax=Pleurocapsa sp. FMAR1 TaxID=3040204 RepID=UPI0029C8C54D|nr:polysaccharide biosynthesis tyrosine autokinase [Pleurocapsa sp. FMAR1]
MNLSQTPLDNQYYWQMIKRRWLPGSIVFLIILTLGIVATTLKKNVYEAEARLKFKSNTVSSSLTEVGKALEGFSTIAEKGNFIDTETEVLRSVPLVKKTINDPKLQLKDREGKKLKVEDFLENLKVSSITATDILKISYASHNPEQAALTVNTLVKNYLDNNLIVNKAEAETARKFLEEQLPRAEDSLHKTEAKIRELKESNGFVDPDENTSSLIQGMRQLQADIAQARGEMANAESQADYIRKKLGLIAEQAVVSTTISQSPAVKETISKLQNAESELAIAKARFTGNSPNVVELQQQVDSLSKLLYRQTASVGAETARDLVQRNKTGVIQEELTTDLIQLEALKSGLQKQIDSLSRVEGDRRARIQKVPELEQKLSQLERQRASFQSTYDALWQKLQTIKIAEVQDPGNVRVISNADVPAQPVSSRAVGFLAAGSLALLSAAGVIYLLEISDRSIKTIDEAKQLYGYTSLGIIPSTDRIKLLALPELKDQDPSIPKLIVRDYPFLALGESYRMLQSNIRSLKTDRKVKTIVITSSGVQEGKSTVAANLAAAMAQVGNRVLLVDANLYDPIQDRIWNTYNDNGLSNVIADRLDPRMSINEVMPNLDLLTSGSLNPSPATLLDSQRMRMLIDYWSESYDFVIFDTPSLDLTADAPIMGRMADGVLLVVRPGLVERSQAKFTKEILEQSGLNMLGIVFNGVEPQFDSRSYYYNALEESPIMFSYNKLPGISPVENEELWDTISLMVIESKKDRLDANLNEDQLQSAPLNKLESMVFHLQQDLVDLSRVVKEQEEELLLQRQKVKKLQRRANVSNENEFYLENQLNQEQERKRMLDETLVGQRRNLQKRREMLFQYQQVLESRQNASFRV